MCLLSEPVEEDAVNIAAASLFVEDYRKFERLNASLERVSIVGALNDLNKEEARWK